MAEKEAPSLNVTVLEIPTLRPSVNTWLSLLPTLFPLQGDVASSAWVVPANRSYLCKSALAWGLSRERDSLAGSFVNLFLHRY